MIKSILIANRGEIACRIINTCQKMGVRSVAVYSEADVTARHVQLADEAIYIGPAPAIESYLNIPRLLAAAQRTGVTAVHPGVGFLAENAPFARACADAGLIFIGPSPEAIEAMGDKQSAHLLIEKAGVPTIPGYHDPDQSDEALLLAANVIGFPLMIKAAGGGGGKGMRLVEEPTGFSSALASARRESQQAFGSDKLILEKALLRPRHIEFQIFGDTAGNVIHLGERECSIQRRYQKIIEESPAPGLTAVLRDQMGTAAVTAAQTVYYTNAGTVEFLLDESGQFYFLEMNTRIQVEHPVTEMVTGLDLIAWQIRIAEGEPLPLTQEQIAFKGHAIEARVYAEDPTRDFLPATGQIALWQVPDLPHIRVDSGVQTGDNVSIYYDPMVAKMIAYGSDRKTTVRRLHYALSQTSLLGIHNNLSFLQEMLQYPPYQAGDLHTNFIPDHFAHWQPSAGEINVALIAVTLAQFVGQSHAGGHWRNLPNQPYWYRYEGQADVALTPTTTGYEVQIGQRPYAVTLNSYQNHTMILTVDGHRQRVILLSVDKKWWVQTRNGTVVLSAKPRLPRPQVSASAEGALRAPMPGVVLAVLVEVGETVAKGQPLMKLEAMKMEHTVRSVVHGVVEEIYFAAGETVSADVQLLRMEHDV